MEPGDPDGLPTEAKCWQVAIRPEGDDTDASVQTDCELRQRFPLGFAAPPLDTDARLSLQCAFHSRLHTRPLTRTSRRCCACEGGRAPSCSNADLSRTAFTPLL